MVVAPSREPFEATLGAEIGALFRRVHESHGVRFHLGSIVYRFEGSHNVEAVVLDNGERIETDMVVVGVGVRPVTNFLGGVELDEAGAVVVDSRMCAADGIYAAGDIVNFVDRHSKGPGRVEHWRTAQQQGRTAARNMAGRDSVFDGVPFFWTRQFDTGCFTSDAQLRGTGSSIVAIPRRTTFSLFTSRADACWRWPV